MKIANIFNRFVASGPLLSYALLANEGPKKVQEKLKIRDLDTLFGYNPEITVTKLTGTEVFPFLEYQDYFSDSSVIFTIPGKGLFTAASWRVGQIIKYLPRY